MVLLLVLAEDAGFCVGFCLSGYEMSQYVNTMPCLLTVLIPFSSNNSPRSSLTSIATQPLIYFPSMTPNQ